MPPAKTRLNEKVGLSFAYANPLPPLFDKAVPATVYSQAKKFGILFHYYSLSVLFFALGATEGVLEHIAGRPRRQA
jgi:hypothetical protein